MNNQYIEAKYSNLTYELKEGTKASYYFVEGSTNILPRRISIGKLTFNNTSNFDTAKIELKANYNKQEAGKYKGLNKHDSIHTRIFTNISNEEYLGYGILDERHKIYDLLVIEKINTNRIKIHHFTDLARPEYKVLVLNFLKELKKKSPN